MSARTDDPTSRLFCSDHVNQPYPRVRDAILANADGVFRDATAVAAAHTATLHLRVGGISIATKVVGVHRDDENDRPATTLMLAWKAVHRTPLFPSITASLAIFALSPTVTQLELRGIYQPPVGKHGEAHDAAAGHRAAEASVARFLEEVAGWLRVELAPAIVT